MGWKRGSEMYRVFGVFRDQVMQLPRPIIIHRHWINKLLSSWILWISGYNGHRPLKLEKFGQAC